MLVTLNVKNFAKKAWSRAPFVIYCVSMNNYNLDTVIYDVSSQVNSKILKDNLVFTINVDENCKNDLIGDDGKLSKILNIIILYLYGIEFISRISLIWLNFCISVPVHKLCELKNVNITSTPFLNCAYY